MGEVEGGTLISSLQVGAIQPTQPLSRPEGPSLAQTRIQMGHPVPQVWADALAHGSAQGGGKQTQQNSAKSKSTCFAESFTNRAGKGSDCDSPVPRGKPHPAAVEMLSLTLSRCSALPAQDGDFANVLNAALLQRSDPALCSCCGTNPLSSSVPQFTQQEKGRGTPWGAQRGAYTFFWGWGSVFAPFQVPLQPFQHREGPREGAML